MSDNWQSEWSRHYDQIQWIATTILTTVIAALLGYSYSQAAVNPLINLIGLGLTLITVYYALSFRELRKELHANLSKNGERAFLCNEHKSQRLRQWPVFFFAFASLAVAWIYKLFLQDKYTLCVGASVITLPLFIWMWLRERAEIKTEKNNRKRTKTMT